MVLPTDIERQLATTTETLSETIDATLSNNGDDEFELRVFFQALTPDPQDIQDLAANNITWTAASDTISGNVNSFTNVRIGDAVTSTSGTDFASSQIVTAIAGDFSSITVSPNTDGATDSGQAGSTITFTAGDIDSTLAIFKIKRIINNTTLRFVVTGVSFDGTNVQEGLIDDNSDNATFADGAEITELSAAQPIILQLEQYLTNARIEKN